MVVIKPLNKTEVNGIILLKPMGNLTGIIQEIGPGTRIYTKNFMEGDSVIYGRPIERPEFPDLHIVNTDDIVLICSRSK